ncbi:DUF262 domain-containing protein [Corynebacterium flavescens]|uniref:GmrSD restriction endonucleases N-terminal domain-containing protein n=1 Tax=Corynebacterium flavescens TaxID=28028 RepID=A0A1L7CNQ8_CORFL|nr:DUF262 domain-containing protein [Corynebacterium flavescens]APT87487.1 hypothetical protein CFLV_10155 [Corynebacterium flavescens]KAA8720301.1 DUF262 domain-containing protein [Corynebacterium flavescens]GEB97029.1 hypothetical protein CFL01nite_05240 [Corynebacterium flavescens]
MKLRKSDLQLESLVNRIKEGEIDLQPDFQRGEVWDSKRRQRLLDTILRDWYVPAIHIVIDDDGEEVVLDGQQRLVAIRKFFSDEVKIDGTIEPYDERIESLHGLKYSQLPPRVRKAVNRFELQIITLTEYEPQEPNELFFRLNQSYNLTPPEKRNALHGEARDQVKALVKALTGTGLLDRTRIGFSNARLAYDDIVARTCVALEVDNIRQHINNKVVEEFYRSRSFSPRTVTAVREAGQLLLRQIEQSDARVKLNKGTLQSWLTYCYWSRGLNGNIPDHLLARFEADRVSARTGDRQTRSSDDRALVQVLRLYDDRASYRVTDVSSVLIRDLTLHLYSGIVFETASYRGADALLDRILADPDSTQTLIVEFLSASDWGNPLVPESSYETS